MSDHDGVSKHVSDLREHDCPTEIASRAAPSSPPELDQTLPSPAGFMDGVRMLPEIDGYEVLEEIGRGGMGAVYRARQRAAGGRVVALKVMLGEAFASSAELRRFEREVEIASDLNHASIAHIYDSGLVQGRHYFAMEYVEGQALDTFCKTRDLPVKGRLRLFAAVCEAVAYAHRRGVIHRDLKPSNILVDNEGGPHVLDFGLAKTQPAAGEVATSRPDLTMDGMLLGTLPYMAPEQAEGKSSSIDTRTDVYALGVILYELLTGKYPYEVTGQMADVLQRIAEAEPRRPSTVNRLIGDEVETIILRALHKLPDRRYSGADDFARDVTHFLAGEPIEAKRDSGLYVLRKTMRRYRVPLAFAGTIILLVAAAAVTSFALYRRAETQRKEAETARAEEQRQRSIAQANEQNAVASKKEAELSQQKATAIGKEATRRLALQFFNEGIGWWFDRQDAAKASACLAEALRVSPEPFPAARMALNNAMRQCPQMSGPPVPATEIVGYVDVSPDGKRVLVRSDKGSSRGWQIWDATTGQPMTSLLSGLDVFDPDLNRRAVLNGATARILEATTGEPVSAPMAHGKKIEHMVFSPDGKRVATVSDEKTVRVWDAATGKPVAAPIPMEQTYPNDEMGRVRDAVAGKPAHAPIPAEQSYRAGNSFVVFSPDGKNLMASRKEGSLQIWDMETVHAFATKSNSLTMLDSYFEGRGAVRAPFSPDGKWILAVSSGAIRVWDVDAGKPVSAPMKLGAVVPVASFSPDGKRVLTSGDKIAQVWDASTGQAVSLPMEHSDIVNSSSFSPDGKWVLTASLNKTVRFWDATTGQPLFAPMHHQWNCIEATFSSSMEHVFTKSYAQGRGKVAARIWDLAAGETDCTTIRCARENDNNLPIVALSPDGMRVVTQLGTSSAQIWDAVTGLASSAPMEHGSRLYGASFTPDGRWVITKQFAGGWKLWDTTTGQSVSVPIQSAGSARIALSSPKDAWVILDRKKDEDNRQIRILDVVTYQVVSVLEDGKGISWAKFSPDRQWVLTGSADQKTVRLWNAATSHPVSSPMLHDKKILSAAFSPDGTRVVTFSSDQTVRIWESHTGKLLSLSPPLSHPGLVFETSFSHDLRRVVITAPQSSARVWDTASGLPVSAPIQPQSLSRWMHAAFSPDGRWVITTEDGSNDAMPGAVRLWDADTGKPISDLMRQDGRLGTVKFTPDGKRALIASDDGTVRIWTIDDVDWDEPTDLCHARVRARLGVEITPTGDMQPLATEELVAAWRDYQRLQADYDRTLSKKTDAATPQAPPPSAPAPVRPPLPQPISATISTNAPLPAAPQPQTWWDFIYRADGAGKATIVKYQGLGGAVDIPRTINTRLVTSIDSHAFSGYTNLTSVTIPAGVECLGIRPMTTGSGARFAFQDSAGLEEIVVDPANNSYCSVNGVLFNRDETTLIRFPPVKAGNYVIPARVTSIGLGAFHDCARLTSLTIPSSITNIWSGAFSRCGLAAFDVDPANTRFSSIDGVLFNKEGNTLICCPAGKAGHYAIPTGVTHIARSAFSECKGLTAVVIPASVINLATRAAGIDSKGCTGLLAITVDAANAKYSSLDGVLFDKRMTSLIRFPPGKQGHYTVPTGVTCIEEGAFRGCASLTGITIPGSVTNFLDSLSGCTELTHVIFEGDMIFEKFDDDGAITYLALGSRTNVIIYYHSDTKGWGKKFGGRPTAVWKE